jgi:hypothetical protein
VYYVADVEKNLESYFGQVDENSVNSSFAPTQTPTREVLDFLCWTYFPRILDAEQNMAGVFDIM